MALKDEFVMFWIFCMVLITFAVRHFFGGIVQLVEHMAAVSMVHMLGVLLRMIWHLR
jgi:hypothetical protein